MYKSTLGCLKAWFKDVCFFLYVLVKILAYEVIHCKFACSQIIVLYTVVNSHKGQHVLNTALNAVKAWCDNHCLKINLENSPFMHVTTRKTPFAYPLHKENLSKVTLCKRFKVTLPSHLKWSKHMKYSRQKCLKKLWSLPRYLFHALPSGRNLGI